MSYTFFLKKKKKKSRARSNSLVHPLFGGSTTGFVSRQRVERGSNDDWTSVIALRKIYGAVGELDLARYAINGENMMGKSVGRRIS